MGQPSDESWSLGFVWCCGGREEGFKEGGS